MLTTSVLISNLTLERYLSSGDFNGFPLRDLPPLGEIGEKDIRDAGLALVENGVISC
jgi:hypothetical protein